MQLNSVGNISCAKPPQRKKGLDIAGNAFVIKLVVRALVIKWLVGKLRLLFDWFWDYSLAIQYIINPENYHSKILASNCAILFSFLLGLHVFPTFVIYELTVLLFLTLSVVIMKVFSFTLFKNVLIFYNLSNLCAAWPKENSMQELNIWYNREYYCKSVFGGILLIRIQLMQYFSGT